MSDASFINPSRNKVMNNLEKPGNLPDDVRQAIMEISKACPAVAFGGSIGLNAVGLLDRPVKDIDLMFTTSETLKSSGIFKVIDFGNIIGEVSETTTDVNGIIIHRVNGKVNGINVCVFQVPELNYSQIKLFGTPINIQDSGEAIRAKRAYAKKNYKSCEKHRRDLEYIDNALNQMV